MHNFIIKYTLLFVIIAVSGCASGGEGRGGSAISTLNGEPVVPRDANRIIVPFFHNHTDEPSVADRLTLRLRQIISMDGRLAVVSKNEDADLRLAGKIVLYQVQPVQYGDFREPVRKRLRIVASIRLFNLKNGREILYDEGIQSFEVFSELLPPVSSEIQVQDRVLENLARRISVKVINGWYAELMTPVEKGRR